MIKVKTPFYYSKVQLFSPIIGNQYYERFTIKTTNFGFQIANFTVIVLSLRTIRY